MHSARIAELLAPFLDDAGDQRLTTADLNRISTYIDLLLRWNARINLTAVRDPEEIVTRHFGESFFAARILFPKRHLVGRAALGCPIEGSSVELPKQQKAPSLIASSSAQGSHESEIATRVEHARAALEGRITVETNIAALAPALTLADIGSGAGFPGIPIKVWEPRISLTLIEANHKKATFLREVVRSLTLTDVNILAARAESLSTTAFDVVALRAVERFESILPVAAGLVASSGLLALLIGSAQLDQARSILRRVSGYKPEQLTPTQIPLSRSRVLAVAQRSD